MAWSKFLIDYAWGQCPLNVEDDLMYFNPAINDVAGGYQPESGVNLTNAELQEDVPTLVESSPEKLTALKSDPRCTWVSDIDWTPA